MQNSNSSHSSPHGHTPKLGEKRVAPSSTPDSSSLTPSSQRSTARRRTNDPQSSPTPQRSSPQSQQSTPPTSPFVDTSHNQLRRSGRIVHPRNFYDGELRPTRQPQSKVQR